MEEYMIVFEDKFSPVLHKKHILWVLIRSASVRRNKRNYRRIISKYSSLTSTQIIVVCWIAHRVVMVKDQSVIKYIEGDNILIFFLWFSEKLRQDISCESSARHMIKMKCLFSLKNKIKKNHNGTYVGALRIKFQISDHLWSCLRKMKGHNYATSIVLLAIKMLVLELLRQFCCNYDWLTHCSWATHKRVISKQCRPWSDAAECGVWSGLHCLQIV